MPGTSLAPAWHQPGTCLAPCLAPCHGLAACRRCRRTPTDIEIAQKARLPPTVDIAARLGIPDDAIEPYGRTTGKIAIDRVISNAIEEPIDLTAK